MQTFTPRGPSDQSWLADSRRRPLTLLLFAGKGGCRGTVGCYYEPVEECGCVSHAPGKACGSVEWGCGRRIRHGRLSEGIRGLVPCRSRRSVAADAARLHDGGCAKSRHLSQCRGISILRRSKVSYRRRKWIDVSAAAFLGSAGRLLLGGRSRRPTRESREARIRQRPRVVCTCSRLWCDRKRDVSRRGMAPIRDDR